MSPRLAWALPSIALAAGIAVATTTGPFSDTTVNDLFVYRTYAELFAAGRLPYLDVGFEYPPLAALPLWLAGLPGRDPATYEVSFGVLMGAFAIAGQQLAMRLAGDRRSGLVAGWLLALTPVLIGASLRTHFDALPVALALGGLLALARGRADLGFLVLGLGTMTKLFPGLLAVVAIVWLAGRGERRSALRGAAIFASVVVLVSLPFAGAGYVDSFEFHLDRPVQIESTPATVLFALGGSEVTGTNLRPDRFKSNGLDGGQADLVAALFAAALVLALAWIVSLAARGRDARHLVLTGFAALLAFVTLGKVFSPQYVIWIAPFAALAWVWGQRLVAALCGVAIVLTHVEFPSRYFDLINEKTDVVLVVAARNAVLLVALVVLVAALRRPAGADCSIDSARSGTRRARHEHRVEPRVLVGGLVALVHVRHEAADRLLLAHADDAAARAGHADVGDVRRAARQDARVGGRDVRVRPDDRRRAAVEKPAERDLLARRLGVEVDEHVVDLAVELAQGHVDVGERRAPGAQEEVAAEVHDAEADAVALDDAGPVAGLAAQVVVGPQDLPAPVHVVEDLAPVVGVVAERDDVDAGAEQLVGDLRRDAQAARRVLAVDDDERRVVALAQHRQQVEERPLAEPADDVAHEENGHRRIWHGPYSDGGDG